MVLLALYCRAVDIGLPWRVSFVPAVLLALYCPAVDIALRWYRSAVASVVRLRFLLAIYCPAVDVVPPLRLSFVYWPAWVSFRPAVRSCWLCYFSDVAFIRRLRCVVRSCGVLLAHYCPAVDNGLPLRLSAVLRFVRLLALYRRALVLICRFVYFPSIALRWYCSAVASILRRGCLLALYCRALVLVRRGVYRPSASTLLPCG